MAFPHSELSACLDRLEAAIRRDDWNAADELARSLCFEDLSGDLAGMEECLHALRHILAAAKASRGAMAMSLLRITAAGRFNSGNDAEIPRHNFGDPPGF
jgi:hypothetical protein